MDYRTLLRDCDLAIVTAPASLFYLSGFDSADAFIAITESEAYYLTDARYEIAAKASVWGDLKVMILSAEDQYAFLQGLVSKAGKIGVEWSHMTLLVRAMIFGENPPSLVDISSIIGKHREYKDLYELSLIKHAEAIVDAAFTEVLPLLRPGVTERRIKEALVAFMNSHGADGTAFDTIVAFGENAAMPHAVPSNRELRIGDCVLMDFGAKYQGYCSDFTRTVSCGAPSHKFIEAYAVVQEAHRAAIDYIEKGGRDAREADRIARDVIDMSAFRGTFNHSLGHGVGIEIHEAPTLSSRSNAMLADGSVFTVEPGIYFEGEFGIRIESLLAIENGKLTVFDRSDKEIIIV